MAEDDFLDSNLEVTVATDRESLLKRARATGEAIVLVLNGTKVGHRAVLGDGVFVIGRGPAAGLQLEGDSISRVHARIVPDGPDYYLIDAGSTNGSFVNNSKVARAKLSDGDEVQIGQVLLKFLSGDNIETAYHEELGRLVRHDALTGALNRPTFDEELKLAVRRQESGGEGLSLVLFDLDHFKEVNDTWGHTAGDLVLRAVAERIGSLVQEPHLFARVGGEEFGVIYSAPLMDAVEFGQRLRGTIAEVSVSFEDDSIQVKTSVGVSEFEGEMTATQLFQSADRLLYLAKETGRNRLCHAHDYPAEVPSEPSSPSEPSEPSEPSGPEERRETGSLEPAAGSCTDLALSHPAELATADVARAGERPEARSVEPRAAEAAERDSACDSTPPPG